jgi:hypothetical protein
MLNAPADVVVRVVDTFVAALVAVTVAPAITAPELSVTVPVMVPSPAVCAFSAFGTARRASNANRENPLRTAFMNEEHDGTIVRFITPRQMEIEMSFCVQRIVDMESKRIIVAQVNQCQLFMKIFSATGIEWTSPFERWFAERGRSLPEITAGTAACL